MTPHTLRIAHFRSFKREQAFRFGRKAGLYKLTGENRVERGIGSNGAGKSSVWDALTWVLFGKTARGLKAGQVANRAQQGHTSVALEFSHNGCYHTLTRTWKPNALILQRKGDEPRTIQQDELEAILKLSFTEFLATIVLGQFNRLFFDLPPVEKLQVFADLLGLGLWQRLSRIAKDNATVHTLQANRLRTEKAELTGRICALTAQTEIAERHEAGYAAQAEREQAVISQQLQDAKHTLKHARISLLTLEANAARYDAAARRQQAHEQRLLSLNRDNADIARRMERNLADAERYAGSRCPECGQPIPDGKAKARRLTDEANRLNDQLASIACQRKQVRTDLQSLTTVRFLNHDAGRLQSARQATARAEANLQALQSRYDGLRSNLNPHTIRRQSLTTELLQAETKQRQLNRQLFRLTIEIAQQTYWAREFRLLRLWLVEESLRQFQIETNNALAQLGLPQWQVSYEVETVNQSGSLSRGFAVAIESPSGSGPWEAWAGGETQRLRIAGAIGLANLIRNARGCRIPLEVWDEPTAHLSDEGIADLLEYFEARSREDNRRIWVIDHRSLSSGQFDGEAKIVKRRRTGSEVRQANGWSNGQAPSPRRSGHDRNLALRGLHY